MTLLEKQFLLTSLLPILLTKITSSSRKVTLGEVWRPTYTALQMAKEGKGIENSLHTLRLAFDLNLFREEPDGTRTFLTSEKDHEVFGLYWETLHPLCRWGGRFHDGNHYSITHNGRM